MISFLHVAFYTHFFCVCVLKAGIWAISLIIIHSVGVCHVYMKYTCQCSYLILCSFYSIPSFASQYLSNGFRIEEQLYSIGRGWFIEQRGKKNERGETGKWSKVEGGKRCRKDHKAVRRAGGVFLLWSSVKEKKKKQDGDFWERLRKIAVDRSTFYG